VNPVFRIVAVFVVIDLESVLHVVCQCTGFASYLFTKLHLVRPSVLGFITFIWQRFKNFFHGSRDIIKTLQKE
jgi:hypothetical protein